MKHKLSKIIAVVFALTVCSVTIFGAPSQVAQGKFRKTTKPIAGEYIVVLKDVPAGQDTSALSDRLSHTYGGVTKRKFNRAFTGFAVQSSEASAQALSDDPA